MLKLWRLQAEGKIPSNLEVGLHHLTVAHDDLCAVLKGTGEYCNCDPDIKYLTDAEWEKAHSPKYKN